MQTDLNVRRGGSTSKDAIVAARELAEALMQPGISFAVFFCSPEYDLDELGAELARHFAGVNLIGCTTAGEITPLGYLEGAITGVSVASSEFVAFTERIDDLRGFEIQRGIAASERLIDRMNEVPQAGARRFGFLLIDGLSKQEESVVSALYRGLQRVELFGGSAADGVNFGATHLYHEGRFRTDTALLTLVETQFPFVVFKTEHFVSSEQKMVVTGADPLNRIVTEINGEPAATEYARLVGLDVANLVPQSFAEHPVVVKLGGLCYVRSIQKVNDDGSLTFFCAIDEGIVLTAARGVDLIENLELAFDRVHEQIGQPVLTLGCDCILRSLELGQRGLRPAVAAMMNDNNVIGFATYGEQYNAMHVNQTFTGVAVGRKPAAAE